LGVAVFGGCASPHWDGGIRRWGTLRGVLRDGDTSAKVRLSEACVKHCYGIGAPVGLSGEIAILDGKIFVSRTSLPGKQPADDRDDDVMATFLATATVPRWVKQETVRDLTMPELAQTVRGMAARQGIDPSRPFPFLVEGSYSTIRMHVLNGRCPFAAVPKPTDKAQDPLRYEKRTVPGRLVGFYDEGPPGILKHAGTRMHVHAVLRGGHPAVAHVDAVSVEAGAVIFVPAVR